MLDAFEERRHHVGFDSKTDSEALQRPQERQKSTSRYANKPITQLFLSLHIILDIYCIYIWALLTLNAIEKERKRKETFEAAAARVDIHLETQVGSMASVLYVFRSAGSRPISLARREGLVSIIQSRQIRLKKSILAQSFIDTNRDGYRGPKFTTKERKQPKEDEIFYTGKMLSSVLCVYYRSLHDHHRRRGKCNREKVNAVFLLASIFALALRHRFGAGRDWNVSLNVEAAPMMIWGARGVSFPHVVYYYYKTNSLYNTRSFIDLSDPPATLVGSAIQWA